jgi:hypothetical protein
VDTKPATSTDTEYIAIDGNYYLLWLLNGMSIERDGTLFKQATDLAIAFLYPKEELYKHAELCLYGERDLL